jgi:hypothetical protein
MKIKNLLLMLLFVVFAMSAHAQNKVGDNPTVIQAGSLLELESLTKGVRLPRVPLNDATKWTLDGSAVSGMLIFNETGTEPKGIYFWSTDASKWVRVINKDELSSLIPDFLKVFTTVGIVSVDNTLKTTVNGVDGAMVNIIKSNTLAGAGNKLTSTVNGVPAVLTPANGTIAKSLGFDAGGNLITAGSTPTSNMLTNTDLNTIISNVNGMADTTAIISSVKNEMIGKTLITTVNGFSASPFDLSSLVNACSTNTLTATNGSLISTVNGKITPALAVLTSGNNGLSTNNGNVSLGGILTKPTTIDVNGNTLTISGLTDGAATDKVVVANAGVLKTIDPSLMILSTTGDVTGTLGGSVLSKIQGIPVSAATPNTNQVLQYNGTNWVPANTNVAITSLNGLTASGSSTQTLATGTTGTAPNWNSVISTHTLNIPLASASAVTAGLISKSDYDKFNNKEAVITAGTTGQYFRGDKTFQTLDKSAVGLSNVDNTSDANKPVSTATQTALDAKEESINKSTDISTDGTSDTKYPTVKAVKTYVDASTIPDATNLVKGKIQLAGDLTGTAAAPSIANNAITSSKILDGTIVDADISTTAAIVDTKLATISSAGKVSNSATTATSANMASAIVARDASGNFSAGTITAVNDLATIAGNLTTSATTANLFNTNATTLNVGGAATTLNLGAATGTTTVKNGLTVTGATVHTGTTALNDNTTLAAGKSLIFSGATSGTATLKPSASTTSYTLTLPNGQGSANQIMSNDGLGNLSWANGLTSSLADGTILVGNGSGVATPVTPIGDVTITNAGVTAIGTGKVTSTQILDGTIADADISATAAIVDTKLATISSAGKVSNSATTATNANTASAIVARDASGNFSAGTITAVNDLATTAGNMTTSATTANLFNTNATTLNVGGAATSLNLGAATGTTTVKNGLTITGATVHTGTTALNDNTTLANGKSLVFTGNAKTVTFTPSATTSSNYVLTLPTTVGGSGQVLTATDASGTLGWSTASNGVTTLGAPGGSNASGGSILDNTLTLSLADATNPGVVSTVAQTIAGAKTFSVAPVVTTFATAGVVHNSAAGLLSTSTIVDADVAASAGIIDTKLATISTTGKVSNSATTATDANTASAIVARDASGNFSAGTITAVNDLATTAGNLTTTAASANVFNTNATTLNVGGAATALNLGAATGTTTVNNGLTVTGATVHTGTTALNDNATLANGKSLVFTGNAKTVTLTPSATTSSSYTLTLPAAQGSANQIMSNDGSGVLSWVNGLTSSLADGTILVGNGSGVATAVTPIGDVTITNAGVTAIGTGKVTSAQILDGTIATSDLAAGAVTASKVEGLSSGQIIVGVDGTAANNAKVTLSGDVTMSNAGVTAIGTGKVTSAQILDGTIATSDLAVGAVTASKVEGLSSGQIIVGVDGTAANNAKVTLSGDVTMSGVGVTAIGTGKVTTTQILDGTIADADISATAAIVDTKLATISSAGKVSNSATTATNANTNSAIVARDASGNFSAGTITASLTGNATTATTLQTTRSIYGNSFNGSADLTGVIASTYGGTGNGFTKFSGPLTAEKTFTLPNASATILTTNAAVTPAQGGTGITSYTTGDLLYASGSSTLNTVSDVAAGSYLRSAGVGAAPVWSTLTLPATTTANGLLYSSATNTVTGLASANNGILVTNSSGVPFIGNTVGSALTMPSLNLSGTSNQVVMQSAGTTGTLTWTPTTTNKTITLPDASGTVVLTGTMVTVNAATYTVAATEETLLVSFAGTSTVTLPAATTCAGKKYNVKNIGASTTVTVKSSGGTIDGVAAATGISGSLQYQGWTFQSDGTNWWIISRI